VAWRGAISTTTRKVKWTTLSTVHGSNRFTKKVTKNNLKIYPNIFMKSGVKKKSEYVSWKNHRKLSYLGEKNETSFSPIFGSYIVSG
jgi:hypothetical protein